LIFSRLSFHLYFLVNATEPATFALVAMLLADVELIAS
jgi:hypothetical protein